MNDQPTEQPKAEAAQKDIMTPEELLPCPFCLSTPEPSSDRLWVRHEHNECPLAGMQLPLLIWNTRTPSKAEEERDEYKRNYEAEIEGNRTLALEMGDMRGIETFRTYCKRVAEERDTLRASLAQAEQEISILKACLRVGEAPCGHSDQYSHSEDGGKVVRCYVCELAQAEQRVKELDAECNRLSTERFDARQAAFYASQGEDQAQQDTRRAEQRVRELEKCCDYDANGKPIERGQTLYLFPGNNANMPAMTLKVSDTRHYCWYRTIEDARDAATSAQAGKESKPA